MASVPISVALGSEMLLRFLQSDSASSPTYVTKGRFMNDSAVHP